MGSPSRDSYDVIVIGSGLGGVSAGALLAAAGLGVLVVERHDAAGGYAHAFRRGPYTIDPAVHVIAEPDFVYGLLDFVGTRERVNLLPVRETLHARYPGLELSCATGAENLIASLSERFPGEAVAVRDFVGVALSVFAEMTAMPHQLGVDRLEEAMRRYPNLFRYRTATLQDLLDAHFTDRRLKALAASPWPYLGSPPSRFSFMAFSTVLASMTTGMYYCEGSFQRLVDALTEGLVRHGGELLLGAEVGAIDVERSRVTGIEVGDRHVSAPIVISNADARHTFEQLVGLDRLPRRYVRRLERLTLSPSACSLYAATTLDLAAAGATHEMFLYTGWDHEQSYRDALAGRPAAMWMTVPTLLDPSLAPPGEHLVVVNSIAGFDVGIPWEQLSDAYAERLVGELDRTFRGFGESVTFRELATPAALERHTLNQRGAIYGWEATPRQAASGRLSHRTAIEGLYLSGHWTQEGAGAFRTLVSGDAVARLVVADRGDLDPPPSFRPASMPAASD